jgi:hypothetical protein
MTATINLAMAGSVIEVDVNDPGACRYRYVHPQASDWSDRPVALKAMYAAGWAPVDGGADVG